MLFYLFNEIHLLKLTLTGNEIAAPVSDEEEDDEDEVAEETSPSHSKHSGKRDPNEILDVFEYAVSVIWLRINPLCARVIIIVNVILQLYQLHRQIDQKGREGSAA